MVVPLLDPKKLDLKVTMAKKTEIVELNNNSKEIARDQPTVEDLEATLPKTAKTPLYHADRPYRQFKEFCWMLWLSCLVDFTPGNGSLAWVSMFLRIPIVLVCYNPEHADVLKKHLKSKLVKAIQNNKDSRFYKTREELDVEPEKQKKKKKACLPQPG